MKKPKPAKFTDHVAIQAPLEHYERIRQRAYELYESRERQDGRELDDWLQAESEVMQEIEH